MPSVVGAVNICSLSGSGNTGNFMNIINERSTTNTKNGSIFSQNISGNL